MNMTSLRLRSWTNARFLAALLVGGVLLVGASLPARGDDSPALPAPSAPAPTPTLVPVPAATPPAAPIPAANTAPAPAAAPAATTAPQPTPKWGLTDTTYLYEVIRHIYRWYLDETDIERATAGDTFVAWVRPLKVPLDEGDRSQFAEILFPQVNVAARVKKADYTIEDLGITFSSPTFRIVNVSRVTVPGTPPEGTQVINLAKRDAVDFLYRTRTQRDFPDVKLLEQMRLTFIHYVETSKEQLGSARTAAPDKPQLVYVASLSPVANEVWVFWETRHMLVRFASDIDLSNPEVWKHESMMVRMYDIDRQVLVSHEEAPGSNAFMMRAEVGRILYNCFVLGLRIEVPPTYKLP
jgi:hypothetical protein